MKKTEKTDKATKAPPKDKWRVLLVDDHPIVRQGIRFLLEQEEDITVCAEAEDVGEALQAFEKHRPDVAVVDIGLKGRDGLELIKSVRATDEDTPILVMSMHDESVYAERSLRAGASGYLMKQEASDKIVKGVREVLNGEIFVSRDIRRKIMHGYGSRTEEETASSVSGLSDRELEVYRLIGQGYSTRQIAGELYLSIKTIETYRSHIKDKLQLNNANELVRAAVQWVEDQNLL